MIVIIAWRGGEGAKSRLAAVLSSEARARLSADMLRQVAEVAAACPNVRQVCVVAPTAPPVPTVGWVQDDRSGVNAAFAAGLRSVETGPVLLLPADLPFIDDAAIQAVLAALSDSPVVIAPDRRREGTNALLLDRPGRLEPAFGAASFDRHCLIARRSGVEPAIVEAPALAFDLDTPADWYLYRLASGEFADAI